MVGLPTDGVGVVTIATRENCAVLFLDLQAGIVPNGRTVTADRLARSAGGLAKLAALHALPAFLSVVPGAGCSGWRRSPWR